MSPAASQFVVSGQEVLPITIALTPSGPVFTPDGFASDVSLEAICIAPDSDVDLLSVQYADPAVPGAVTNTIVGLGAPFVSQINARTGVNGKIVFGTPRSFLDPFAQVALAGSKLKAFGYFQKPSVLPIVRADSFGTAVHVLTGVGQESMILKPYYGRRILYVDAYSPFLLANMTIRVLGINYAPSPHATLLFTGVIPGPGSGNVEFSMTNKFYDAIEVTAQGTPPDSVGLDFTFADAL